MTAAGSDQWHKRFFSVTTFLGEPYDYYDDACRRHFFR
jgi:hypothetical protein